MTATWWEAASFMIAVTGGILLWISYALFGLIARRYGQVFGTQTYSTLLILAPSGLLVYALFLILQVTVLAGEAQWGEVAQWVGYLAIVVSGVCCLVGVARFAAVLAKITRPQSVEQKNPRGGKP